MSNVFIDKLNKYVDSYLLKNNYLQCNTKTLRYKTKMDIHEVIDINEHPFISFDVVCDETNNTPEVIEDGEFHLNINTVDIHHNHNTLNYILSPKYN